MNYSFPTLKNSFSSEFDYLFFAWGWGGKNNFND